MANWRQRNQRGVRGSGGRQSRGGKQPQRLRLATEQLEFLSFNERNSSWLVRILVTALRGSQKVAGESVGIKVGGTVLQDTPADTNADGTVSVITSLRYNEATPYAVITAFHGRIKDIRTIATVRMPEPGTPLMPYSFTVGADENAETATHQVAVRIFDRDGVGIASRLYRYTGGEAAVIEVAEGGELLEYTLQPGEKRVISFVPVGAPHLSPKNITLKGQKKREIVKLLVTASSDPATAHTVSVIGLDSDDKIVTGKRDVEIITDGKRRQHTTLEDGSCAINFDLTGRESLEVKLRIAGKTATFTLKGPLYAEETPEWRHVANLDITHEQRPRRIHWITATLVNSRGRGVVGAIEQMEPLGDDDRTVIHQTGPKGDVRMKIVVPYRQKWVDVILRPVGSSIDPKPVRCYGPKFQGALFDQDPGEAPGETLGSGLIERLRAFKWRALGGRR